MTALKIVHQTQPHDPQAALLAERADVVGELEAISRKLAKLAEAEGRRGRVRRNSPALRQLSDTDCRYFSCGTTIETAHQEPPGDMPIICATKYWRNVDRPFPPDGVAVRPPDPVNALTRKLRLERGARIERAGRQEVLRSRLAHSPRPRRATRLEISDCDDATGADPESARRRPQ